MKKFFIIIFACFVSDLCYSQLLEGQWQGSYSTDLAGLEIGESLIELNFRLIGDTSYQIYSYSTGENTKGDKVRVTAKVYYKLISKDSIYLEEIEDLEPPDAKPMCFQKMLLRITKKKKRIILEGTWTSDSTNNALQNCNISGKIKFQRKD